ncbi:MAG: c-type cytochrome biogenesis protein CcmI [Hyphomicrobiaceae bacterium]|nr:c-type cytochrome biogenesis protein CcmI [Hyphomicrobiaceae bacterium]
MMLWVILTLMIVAASLFLAAPFLRADASARAPDPATEANVYRDQLAEIDRELADGAIDATQAEASRLEIKRRVFALQRDADAPVRILALIERKFFAGIIAGGIALGGTILYAFNGSPDIPSARRTSTATPASVGPNHPPIAGAAQPGPSAQVGGVPQAQALSSVDEMVDRLVQRLTKSPGDADGWRMLGWSYFRTDRYQEAAAAYAKASALQPSVGALKTAWAEALVRAADGKVTPESLRLSEEALKLDAKDPRARYFIGLAKEQAGDASGALDAWIALLRDANSTDDWEAEVRQQTQELAKASGIDIGARLPVSPTGPGILGKLKQEAASADATQPAATAPQQSIQRGPTAADVKAAESLSASDRTVMIRSMVDGLQTRLDANPRDADGWIKLLRSRVVLGEMDQAKAALARALKVFADTPSVRDQISATAREVGISP